ncbi:MAG: hypothetical protein EA359_12375 [Balneolaceae bacterium]|nr:MAG: hypothetical protein EA359_12375 [Balneolaceae bacterium]
MYQNYNALQTAGNNEIITARNRLRLQMQHTRSFGGFRGETDLIQRYNKSTDIEIRLRELYIDWFFGDYDLRIGKQKIIWGRATGGFITDILTPVDLREFLTQDPEDLRIGLTAINLTRYYGSNFLQIVLSPVFEPDLLPEPDSRWFPIQMIPGPIPVTYKGTERSTPLKDAGLALRYGIRSPSRLDLDLMLLRWTHPMPTYGITFSILTVQDILRANLNESYQHSWMGGLSASFQLYEDLFLTGEALFVKDRLFTYLPVSVERLENALTTPNGVFQLLQDFEFRDDGYLVNKPWLNSMIGVETNWHNTTIGAQFFVEGILNYEEKILPQRIFPYVTFLATRNFAQDRLRVLTLTRYNIYAEDFWFQLQGTYEAADGLEISLGTNLFGGDPVTPFYGHFSFNRFRENSFIFTRIAFYF